MGSYYLSKGTKPWRNIFVLITIILITIIIVFIHEFLYYNIKRSKGSNSKNCQEKMSGFFSSILRKLKKVYLHRSSLGKRKDRANMPETRLKKIYEFQKYVIASKASNYWTFCEPLTSIKWKLKFILDFQQRINLQW